MGKQFILVVSVLAVGVACGSGSGSAKVSTATHPATGNTQTHAEPPPPAPGHVELGQCKSMGQAYADARRTARGGPAEAERRVRPKPMPPKAAKPRRRPPLGSGAPSPTRLRMPPPPRIRVRLGAVRTNGSVDRLRLQRQLRRYGYRLTRCLSIGGAPPATVKVMLHISKARPTPTIKLVRAGNPRTEACVKAALRRMRVSGIAKNATAMVWATYHVQARLGSIVAPTPTPVPAPPPPPNSRPDPAGDMEPPAATGQPRVPPALLAKYARDVVHDEFAKKLNLLRTCFPPVAFERMDDATTMRISLTINKDATVVSSYATGTPQYSTRQCVSSLLRGVSFSKKPPAGLRVSCELTVHPPGTGGGQKR